MTDNSPIDPELLPSSGGGVEPGGGAPSASSTEVPELMQVPRHLWRRISVWVIALGFGIAVPLFVPRDMRFEWFVLAVGACVLITFALQLGTAQREGFISRIATSIAGSVVIIALAEGVTRLLA